MIKMIGIFKCQLHAHGLMPKKFILHAHGLMPNKCLFDAHG